MTDEQKTVAIQIIMPEAKVIQHLDNGLVECEHNGGRYHVEVYTVWNTIKVQGFEERLSDTNKSGGLCRGHENYIARSKRVAFERIEL